MPRAVAGVLRLAVKYECPSIVDQLRPAVERDWPDDFVSWAHLEDQFYIRKEKDLRQPENHTTFNVNWYFSDPGQLLKHDALEASDSFRPPLQHMRYGLRATHKCTRSCVLRGTTSAVVTPQACPTLRPTNPTHLG